MNNIKKAISLVDECKDFIFELAFQEMPDTVLVKKLGNKLTELKKYLEDFSATISPLSIAMSDPIQSKILTQKTEPKVNRESASLVAFVMAKYDYSFFNDLYCLALNQGEAFEMLAALLGIKPTTLRNYRDSFDSHVTAVRGKQRQGWKKELTPEFAEIKAQYDGVSEEQMKQIVDETLKDIHPDTEIIVRVAYGFLFAPRAKKTDAKIVIDGQTFDVVSAPYARGIAYLVFTGFDNTLVRGTYPAVYVYRDLGKVFSVFGESVKHLPIKGWQIPPGDFPQIEECLTGEELEIVNTYPYSYRTNRVHREFTMDQNASGGKYKIEMAEQIVLSLKDLISLYVEINT